MEKITGTVSSGKQIGRTLGFPTANVVPDVPFSGQRGVYAATVAIDGVEGAYRAMVNVGTHPTFPEGAPTIEAHILDFDCEIYGKRISLTLTRFLRPERKFDSADALIRQLVRDREVVKNG